MWGTKSKKSNMALSQFLYTVATGSTIVEDPELKKFLNKKKEDPWHKENLTKLERKGKTWEELNELRKRKWVERVLNKEKRLNQERRKEE